ncbi:hypothetical protein [Thermoflexibacter ruber]|uniref:Uncharacterized protein n=1 Tax=Thermoflexibacter ruber TaxID=1003 RepID=A0A1I2JK32_9BACT|nr:hypothetical protein [Thermoflexibacter ruber]SFF54213.1 hypothetical protein SAMN04488541_105213 [Thermoflexibacter ruber]
MKKIIFIFFVFLFGYKNAYAQDFITLDFQSFFLKDTVSLLLNDKSVFKNQILNTEEWSGLTKMQILITKISKRKYYVSLINSPTDYKISHLLNIDFKKSTSIKIIINSLNFVEKININKGRYFGITYDNENKKIIIKQQKELFYYD